jgi:hypothetical protein
VSRVIIEAQRAGFVAGAQAASKGRWTPAKQLAAIAESETQFPLTIEQARVIRVMLPPRPNQYGRVRLVEAPFIEYRLVNGVLESRCPVTRSDAPEGVRRFSQQWKNSHLFPEILDQLKGLYANPNETVEVQ